MGADGHHASVEAFQESESQGLVIYSLFDESTASILFQESLKIKDFYLYFGHIIIKHSQRLKEAVDFTFLHKKCHIK